MTNSGELKKLTDRRAHRRIPVNRQCWLEGERVTLYGRITNASERGAFVRIAAPVIEGESARLICTHLEGGQTIIKAEVVWVSDGVSGREPGCGLSILDFEQGEIRWNELLKSIASGESGI